MIRFEQVQFSYHDKKEVQLTVPALSIRDGECVLLTGVSGSGKSTITKCINGLIPEFFEGDFSGDVFIHECNLGTMPVYEISKFAGSVFQDPSSQFFTEHPISELAFACENYGVAADEIKRRMEYAVTVLHLEPLIDKRLSDMSNGEKQKTAIASVLTMQPHIILFDEPSSNLDYASILMLRDIIAMLKSKGLTVIVAEHRIYYLEGLFDRVLYISGGKIESEYRAAQFSAMSNEALHALGLRSLRMFLHTPHRSDSECAAETTAALDGGTANAQIALASDDTVTASAGGVVHAGTAAPDGKIANTGTAGTGTELPAVQLKNISYSYKDSGKPILNKVTADLYRGEVTALIGRNGIGKTTLARIMTGLYRQDSGAVLINGKETAADKRIGTIQFVMNDVDYQLFGDSVYNELLIGNADIENLHQKIETVLKQLNLQEVRDMHPMSLSGGQKQRLVIAASCIRNSALTVLDEPTSGLDYRNMLQVSALLQELAANRNAVLIISHDYEFIINTCSRILLLTEHGITGDFRLSGNAALLQDIFVNRLGGGGITNYEL